MRSWSLFCVLTLASTVFAEEGPEPLVMTKLADGLFTDQFIGALYRWSQPQRPSR